jgi:hypothetical protein
MYAQTSNNASSYTHGSFKRDMKSPPPGTTYTIYVYIMK